MAVRTLSHRARSPICELLFLGSTAVLGEMLLVGGKSADLYRFWHQGGRSQQAHN